VNGEYYTDRKCCQAVGQYFSALVRILRTFV
jgi:hypothetical protein